MHNAGDGWKITEEREEKNLKNNFVSRHSIVCYCYCPHHGVPDSKTRLQPVECWRRLIPDQACSVVSTCLTFFWLQRSCYRQNRRRKSSYGAACHVGRGGQPQHPDSPSVELLRALGGSLQGISPVERRNSLCASCKILHNVSCHSIGWLKQRWRLRQRGQRQLPAVRSRGCAPAWFTSGRPDRSDVRDSLG